MIKRLLAIVALFLTTSAIAIEKKIEVSVLYKEGGTTFERSKALAEGLSTLGWDVNFVPKGNCHNMLKYVQGKKTPLVFLNSDSSITEVAELGCDTKPTDENFATMLYKRDTVLCSTKDETVNSFRAKIINGTSFKVGATTFYPQKVIDAMGKSTGKTFKMVPYNKSTVAIKGQIAGDTDFYLGGMQPKTMDNVELSCIVHGKNSQIDGMIQFGEIFPNYEYANIATHYFAHTYNVDADVRAELAKDLRKVMELSSWRNYITKSQMTSASELTHIKVADIIDSLEAWAQ